MKLRVEHHKVFVEEASSIELASLKKSLKIYSPLFNPPPGSPPFTLINLYYKEDKSFPTGYLNIVKKKIEKELTLTIIDKRSYPAPHLKMPKEDPDREDLWEHQDESLVVLKQEPVGVVSAATGTGKTRTIEEVVRARAVKTLIIVPSRSIQAQMYTQFSKVFGKKMVSFKIPKKEQDKTPDKDNKNNKDYSDYTTSFSKVGGKVSDLYENKNQDNVKRMGSSYSPIKGEKYEGSMKRMGSSYAAEFFPDNGTPEDLYQKKKGLDKNNKKANMWGKNKFAKKPTSSLTKKRPIKKTLGADITIICFQSLPEASVDFLRSIECVIVDECHHSSAITIRESLDIMNKAAYRYGFSATPWRDKSDEYKLFIAALGDKILYDIGGREAVERGIIAKPKLEIIISPTPEEWLKDYTNWRMIVDKGLVGNITRNKTIIKKAIELYRNDHNVFICVDEIAHLEILLKRLKDEGIDALSIHGQQSDKLNEENIKKVAECKSGIISIGTMAVGEGTNMPNITAVILAGGGKSSIRFLQRIGRGTRIVDGKTELIVVDFEDWFNPTLLKHSKARQRIFKKIFS